MSQNAEIIDNPIGKLVREAEHNYVNGETVSSKYVVKSMYEDIQTIDAYLNSKHISGETDSLGREKPFFNIVTSAVNIWYRATDIDRKNVRIKATKEADIMASYIATAHLQAWMKKENFGMFLNDWGRQLARYGSAICKFVEQDGKLYPRVMSWQNMIVDAINFDSNIKIEILELTEAELYQRKGYNKDMVEKLCDTAKTRETIERQQKDTKQGYIKLYEVHGLLPKSYLTGKETDEDIYVQQMHVVSFVASKENGKFDDFTLYSGQEERDPYILTHLIKEDGQTLSIGAVQNLFQAQWMVNHSVKSIKDQLDLASKLIFQTSDGNFVGQNALTAIEQGDILIHAVNQPITQVNNGSHDVTSMQNFGTLWKSLGNEINGISEAMLGINPPSGSAWRQTEALLQESHSLFEVMTENKGLYLEQMLREYIIPFLKKKMDTTEEISVTLSDYGIDKIEKRFIKNKANEIALNAIKKSLLKGEVPQGIDVNAIQSDIKQTLNEQGNNRFIKPSDIKTKTWKESLKDLEWEVEVDITGENHDSQNVMTTLNTLLATLVKLNGQPMSPEMKLVFNRILTEAGSISPLELDSVQSETPAQQGVLSPIQPQTLPVNQVGGATGV